MAKTPGRPPKGDEDAAAAKPAKGKKAAPAAKPAAGKKAAPAAFAAGKRAAPAAKAEPAPSRRKTKVDPRHEAIYREHKEDIDRELRLCTGHLKQLKGDEVAVEAVRRLKRYYYKHGAETPEGLSVG